jgi:CBS domain-containing protein
MKLFDLMSRDVEVVRPNATVNEAARKMRERDVGALPVCDGRRLVGMITDRDIVVRALAQGKDPSRTRVRDVHTERVLYAFEDDDVHQVAEVMQAEQIRRMPVVDRDRRLVGIVALADLATVAGDVVSGEVLEGISQPKHWSRLSETGGGRTMHVGEVSGDKRGRSHEDVNGR